MRTIVIMGAAGRDFHDFNVVFRDDSGTRVADAPAAVPRSARSKIPQHSSPEQRARRSYNQWHRANLERKVSQPARESRKLGDFDFFIGFVIGFLVTGSPPHGLDAGLYERIGECPTAAGPYSSGHRVLLIRTRWAGKKQSE